VTRAPADPDNADSGATSVVAAASDVDDAARATRRTSTRVFRPALSGPGSVVALLFFALSLLPSMLPRTYLFQGIVSGISMMIGYALGTTGQWAWRFLRLPQPRGRARTIVMGTCIAVVAWFVASGTWRHVGWQNEVRQIYGVQPITPIVLGPVLAIAIVVALLLLVIARTLRKLFDVTWHVLHRRLPRRLSLLLGGVIVLVLVNLLYNGVLVNAFFAVSNQVFSASDTTTKEGQQQPTSDLRSGGPGSAASWESLGRQGRSFVATGPTIEDLNAFAGGGAIEPIRVYAGLKSAETLQARADLVLDELIRTGAFDREVLVVGTTTGTGFLDAAGVDPVEYLHNGDTAIVGVQYSYLPSWISLLADQQEVQRTARVVFDTIHAHWSDLPQGTRPELYLYGLSLGSYGAESVLTSIGIVNEPIDGALLVGPPFVNELWNRLVANRRAGTPPWLPVYQDGVTVRFTGERDVLRAPEGPWGPTRITYLQHASDPVVFFSPDLAFEQPDWLQPGQRGPGIAQDFVWVPLVTFWQMAFDLAAAGDVPIGWGHRYSPEANGSSWAAVTRPVGWTDEDTQRLRDFLASLPVD
jgi:uncharacterized membrane protein